MAFEREEDLRTSFTRHAMPATWSRVVSTGQIRTRRESTCSEGRADWVWAWLRSSGAHRFPAETTELLQQPTCSRILCSLKPVAPRSEKYLLDRVGVSDRTLRFWLQQLIDADLVREVNTRRFSLGRHFVLPEIEICSFEFKLSNWRRAFYQARRYRAFSHRVYVVMPSECIPRIQGTLNSFEQFNIGLIGHDIDGDSSQVLPSRKQPPRSRERFIRAVGMLLDQEAESPAIV